MICAGITLSAEPSTGFDLEIDAPGVHIDFVKSARDGLLTALLSQSYCPVLRLKVTMSGFKVDEVSSSQLAFYMVAKEAAEKLLGIAEGYESNIQW